MVCKVSYETPKIMCTLGKIFPFARISMKFNDRILWAQKSSDNTA